MKQPKFEVNDIVSDCDLEGEFIIREVEMSDGFFYDYWIESLTQLETFLSYEDELTLVRKGE